MLVVLSCDWIHIEAGSRPELNWPEMVGLT